MTAGTLKFLDSIFCIYPEGGRELLFKQTLGWVAAVLLIVFTCRVATADTLTIPNTFTSGTTIQSSQMNQNFTTISNLINGNITNSNIKAAAAIAASKLSLTGIASEITTVAATGTNVFSTKVTADGSNRFALTSNGLLKIDSALNGSPGELSTASGSIFNFRAASGVLSATLNANNIIAESAAGGSAAFRALINGDAAQSIWLGVTSSTSDVSLGLGDRTTGVDIYLRRDSASNMSIRNGPGSGNTLQGLKVANVVANNNAIAPATAATANQIIGVKSVAANGYEGKTITGAAPAAFDGSVATSGDSIQIIHGANTIDVQQIRFTSAAQTITAAGSLTLAHGLGVTPAKVWAHLKNTTAELNYSQNDLVPIYPTGNAGGLNVGFQCVADSSNLNIRFGSTASSFQILNKTTGAVGNITNANWQIIFYAEP